jgi:hypothetical protein
MRLALRIIRIIIIANPPETTSKKLDGSGTTVGTIAMPLGLLNPDIRAGFTVAPSVVYSPIVPLRVSGSKWVTNRSDPDTAIPTGKANPDISAGFTVAPEVVYLPIVPATPFATNRSEPDTAIPRGSNPDIRAGFTVAPSVVYSPIVPKPRNDFVTKIVSARAVLSWRVSPSRTASGLAKPYRHNSRVAPALQT